MSRSPITDKEVKFVSEYVINGGNATEAAMNAYDCANRNSARSLGSQNLARLSIPEIMDSAGITIELLMAYLKEGLEAKKYRFDETSIPDLKIRVRYLEIAFRLRGLYTQQDKSHTEKEFSLNALLSQLKND